MNTSEQIHPSTAQTVDGPCIKRQKVHEPARLSNLITASIDTRTDITAAAEVSVKTGKDWHRANSTHSESKLE